MTTTTDIRCGTCNLCHGYDERNKGLDPFMELANKVMAATLRLGVGICVDEPTQPFLVDLDGRMPCGGESWEPRPQGGINW